MIAQINTVTAAIVTIMFLSFLPIRELQAEEICLKNAWQAFKSEKYEIAVKFANKCIDDFAPSAARKQSKFDENNRQCPAIGAVSDAEKSKIFANGLLNDVATAFFIKGRAAEYLHENVAPANPSYKDAAKQSYITVCRFKCGRTWDPRGWFWSPCEAASDRLPIE